MASIIYGLCAVVAFLCAYLLLRSYRRQGYRLLLWSALCFIGFTANNALLVLDKLVYSDFDFSLYRAGLALGSVSVLLYGLIWDAH